MMENLNDEVALIKQLRDGDSIAIQKLYDAYADRLYSFVFNRVGKAQEASEDIVQETFLAAIKSANRFDGRSKVFTWLCSIAYHKISDFYRRCKQIESIHSVDVEQIQIDSTQEPGTDGSKETSLVVEQVLFSLPLDYQHVLTLKYIEDMPVKEISQIMGRSVKSVEGLLSRARRELKTKLTVEMKDDTISKSN
jgi:RNA polymerase sigma-70 factor (ECF subfamily)